MVIAVNTRLLLKDKLEGIGVFLHETLRRIVAAHPEDTFIFLFDRPFDASFIFGKNVVPIVLSPPARHPILFVYWFEIAVRRALKKHKVDVFLSPDNFLSLSTTVKTLLVVHDIAYLHFTDNERFIYRLYYQYFMPRFLRRADRIVAVSEFTRQDLLTHFDFLQKEKIAVACNGVRDFFYPHQVNKRLFDDQNTEGGKFFLFVGAVHPRKNVHRLIEAFDLFKKKTNAPHKLVIVGRFAWQTGVVKTAFDDAKNKKDIIFTGYLPDKDVADLTASAFALCYVSLFEGFGVPILEAFHTETPVITSNTSSMPEVAGDAALLVSPESVESIAEAMEKLYFSPELRQDLIEKGKIQREKFSWEKAAKVLYDNILALKQG